MVRGGTFHVFKYWAKQFTSSWRSSLCWIIGDSVLTFVFWLKLEELCVAIIGGGMKIGEFGTVGGIITMSSFSWLFVQGIIGGCAKRLVLANDSWILLMCWSN